VTALASAGTGAGHQVAVWSSTRRDVPGWAEAMALLTAAGIEIVDPGPDAPKDPSRAAPLLSDADALIVGTDPIPESLLASAPRLRLVSKPGIGVDRIDVAAATRRGIGVANTPGSNSDTVADHTIGLMLAVLRRVVTLDAVTRTGRGWESWPVVGGELAGATVAVLGTGDIGRAVIRRLAGGFGSRVSAYDVAPDALLTQKYGVVYGPLHEILPTADVVTVHVPLLDSTRGLLGAPEFALMKPTAVVVNAARGGVVDEAALHDALVEGRIAGAALDVFADEPLGASPLRDHPGVVLTPHIAGYSERSLVRARLMLAADIVDALAGEPRHLVNPEVLDSPHNRIVREGAAAGAEQEKGSIPWRSR
jgi:D-3-phosphoglycerate dehydrogenase